MIEIVKEGGSTVYKREIPKNVRQIGEVRGKTKIYIEDYIITFMKQISTRDDKPKAMILYGDRQVENSETFLFVNGAILAECPENMDGERTVFKEDVWKEVNEKSGHFFKDSMVLGWIYLRYDLSEFAGAPVINTHKQFFREDQQIYMEYSVSERIENLYLFEKNHMELQSGYYVYYEQNEAMQNYMITVKQDEPEEVKKEVDKATRKFRGIVQEKKEEIHRKQTMGVLYGTSVAMLLIVTIIGVTMMNNYEKMQDMEKVLHDISAQMTEEEKNLEPGKVEVVTQDATLANVEIDGQPEEAALTSALSVESPPNKEYGEGNAGNGALTLSENSATNEADEDTLLAAGIESDISASEQIKTEADVPAESVTETTVEQRDPLIKAQEGISVPGIYCIEKGDTLAKISTRFYGDESMIDRICQANNIADKNSIQYGVNIVLP